MYEIYPKQLARARVPLKEQTCFVLMPFSHEFDEIYAELKLGLKHIGFDCRRADDIYANRPIMSTIVLEILSNHFIIADLTNRSPNVFYEVGIAHVVRDYPNVLLISQSMEHVPFDLRHLPVVVYQRDNLRLLTSRITRTIQDNRIFLEGRLRLFNRYYHLVGNEPDFDELVSFLDGWDRSLWELLFTVFGVSSHDAIPGESVTQTVFQLHHRLGDLVRGGRLSLFKNVCRVFNDILLHFAGLEPIDAFVRRSLAMNRVEGLALDETAMNSVIIDLSIAFFKHPTFKRQAIEWMMGYLSREKIAGIDLNRAKIESFILTTSDPEIHEALVYSLSSEKNALRETAADAVGELRLGAALRSIVVVLDRERDPYVARSIFVAIGKLGSPAAAEHILRWIDRHQGWVREREMGFVFDYAREASGRIDALHGTSLAARLEEILSKVTPPRARPAKKASTHQPRKPRRSG